MVEAGTEDEAGASASAVAGIGAGAVAPTAVGHCNWIRCLGH